MSAITIESDLVHYEVLGRGRPVVFVHGWLGSWRYWVPTMQQLSMKYRTYALDLWGFGDSGKDPSRYGLREQVHLLYSFLERLGIPKAAFIGHSLGAAVCINFARQHPERAHRLLLISAPLFDLGGLGEETAPLPQPVPAPPAPPQPAPQYSTTSETIPRNPFRSRAETPEEILARLRARSLGGAASRPEPPEPPEVPKPAPKPPPRLPQTGPLLPTSIAKPILPGSTPPSSTPAATPSPALPGRPDNANPLISRLTGIKPLDLLLKHAERDTPDLDTLRAEVGKTDEQAIWRSAESFTGFNLALELKRLVTPALLLHGEDDTLLPSPVEDLLRRINAGKAAGHFLPLIEPGLKHFPMLEITAKFNRLLVDFLEAPDLTNVQFKDQWRRTMR